MQTPTLKFFVSLIIFFGLCGFSQERQAEAHFTNVKDGDVLSLPINIEFGVEGFELAPSGTKGERVGHHHLLVNRDSIMGGVVIPGDVTHILFRDGETRGMIELEQGSYLLTLLFADSTHRSFGEKMSASVAITVK